MKITDIYQGRTKLWSSAPLGEVFSVLGVLDNWIIDGVDAIEAGLSGVESVIVSDGLGNLVNGIGTSIGNIVAFVPNPANIAATLTNLANNPQLTIGVLIAQIPSDLSALDEAICAQLETLPTSFHDLLNGIAHGLTGFLNGLPTLGGIISTIEGILDGDIHPLTTITSLIGMNTVTTQFAQVMGILADQATGALSDSINYVTDATGAVVGWVTCGGFWDIEANLLSDIQYPIGVVGNVARMLLPSGLVSLPLQTSYARTPITAVSDDGILEILVSSVGSPGFVTQVFRRWDNSGAAGSGTGIDLRSSLVSIVARIDSVDTLVAPAIGTYTVGDVLHLVQTGNIHTVYKNGRQLGQWIDSELTAAVGVANRSVAMAMQASKTLLGPVNHSPTLAYVLAA